MNLSIPQSQQITMKICVCLMLICLCQLCTWCPFFHQFKLQKDSASRKISAGLASKSSEQDAVRLIFLPTLLSLQKQRNTKKCSFNLKPLRYSAFLICKCQKTSCLYNLDVIQYVHVKSSGSLNPGHCMLRWPVSSWLCQNSRPYIFFMCFYSSLAIKYF